MAGVDHGRIECDDPLPRAEIMAGAAVNEPRSSGFELRFELRPKLLPFDF